MSGAFRQQMQEAHVQCVQDCRTDPTVVMDCFEELRFAYGLGSDATVDDILERIEATTVADFQGPYVRPISNQSKRVLFLLSTHM